MMLHISDVRSAVVAAVFLAATAVATGGASAATEYSAQDDADAKCVASFAYTLGNMPDAETTEETAGVTGLMFYFIGKLKGRHPSESMSLFVTPDLTVEIEPTIQNELERCKVEAGDLIADLELFNESFKETEN